MPYPSDLLVTHFLDWSKGYPKLDTQTRGLLNLVAIASICSFLSALAHFTVLVFYAQYIKDLRRGVNKFRWWEYAASSSLMIALLSSLSGV